MPKVTISNPRKAGRVIMVDGGSVRLPAGGSTTLDLTYEQIEAEKEAGLEVDGESASEPKPRDDEDRFDAMTDDELREYLEEETGDKPHWNAKRETLLEKARDL